MKKGRLYLLSYFAVSVFFFVFLFLPVTSAKNLDIEFNSENVSVELVDNQDFECNNNHEWTGCAITRTNGQDKVLIYSDSRPWLGVMSTCSHELWHLEMDKSDEEEHEIIEEKTFDGMILPWEMKEECLEVANTHIKKGVTQLSVLASF